MMSKLLNSNQRRSVTVTLRQFEIRLRQALALLDEKNESGILYRETLHLSDRQKAEMQQDIAKALNEIAALGQELALESSEQDAGGLIRSEMAISWTNLLDIRSKKLRGYGVVHPNLAEKLDPPIERLSKIALKLANHTKDAEASGENNEHH